MFLIAEKKKWIKSWFWSTNYLKYFPLKNSVEFLGLIFQDLQDHIDSLQKVTVYLVTGGPWRISKLHLLDPKKYLIFRWFRIYDLILVTKTVFWNRQVCQEISFLNFQILIWKLFILNNLRLIFQFKKYIWNQRTGINL